MGAPQGPAAKTSGCPCRPWKAGKAPPPRSTCPGPSASQGWQECHLWVGTEKAAYCVHLLRGPGAPVGQESGPRVPEEGSGARGGRRGSQKSQADASTLTPPSTLTVQGVKVNEHSPPQPRSGPAGTRPGGQHWTPGHESLIATMEPDLSRGAFLSRAEDRLPGLAGHTGSVPTPRFRCQTHQPRGVAGCQ